MNSSQKSNSKLVRKHNEFYKKINEKLNLTNDTLLLQENSTNLKNFYAKVRFLNRKHNAKKSKHQQPKGHLTKATYYCLLKNTTQINDKQVELSEETDESRDDECSSVETNDPDKLNLNYYGERDYQEREQESLIHMNSLKKYLNLIDSDTNQESKQAVSRLSEVENEAVLKKLYKKFDLSMQRAPFNPIINTKNEYYHQIISKYHKNDTSNKKRWKEPKLGLPQATLVASDFGINGYKIGATELDGIQEPNGTPQQQQQLPKMSLKMDSSMMSVNPQLDFFKGKIHSLLGNLEINGVGQVNSSKMQASKINGEQRSSYTFKMSFPNLTQNVARKLLNASYYPLSISKYQVDFRSETIRDAIQRQEKTKKSSLASQTRIIFPNLLTKSNTHLSHSLSTFDGLTSTKLERAESEALIKKRDLKRSKSELRPLQESKPRPNHTRETTQFRKPLQKPQEKEESREKRDSFSHEFLSKSIGDYKHVATSTSGLQSSQKNEVKTLADDENQQDQKHKNPIKLPPIKINSNAESDVNIYKNYERINLNY